MSEWFFCEDRLPEIEDDYGAFTTSRRVVACDCRGNFWTAYLQRWQNDEYPSQWKLAGPDGHILEDIVAWMNVPPRPFVPKDSHHG